MFNNYPINHDFRRSNCLRQALPTTQASRQMNSNNTGPHLPNSRPTKKPPYIDYTTLSRLFRRKNLASMKKGFSIQQCASILLPIIFTSLLIAICTIAALALLTDGFSLCNCRSSQQNDFSSLEYDNSSSVCLTNECIRKAYFLIDKIDKNVPVCDNFFRFACGRSISSEYDQSTRFETELRSKLEQKPRPSFPLPYRLLFDFYDSCISEDHQEQLGTQPFNTFISRLGGWPLLQNAKFDEQSFEWESLEQHLHNYGISGLFSIKIDTNANTMVIKSPQFLLSQYRRQSLDEYFTRLLVELEVDEELAQVAVQEALDFESNLINAKSAKSVDSSKEEIKLTLADLKKRYTKIQWNKFAFPMNELKETEVRIASDHLERVETQLDTENGKKSVGNYMLLRMLHSIAPYMPRRYRSLSERLNNKYQPRWQSCFNEILDIMPLPLYGFSFYQQQQEISSSMISKSKEQVVKQLRSLGWVDSNTKDKMIKNLHNLRVITNLLNGSQMETQIRVLYSSERLDPTSYFDNILMLRQTNSGPAYKSLIGDYNWEALLLSEDPEIDVVNNELVYGPVSIRALLSLPESIQTLQIRKQMLEYLFHSDAINQWKPEPRSILQAKVHCFEKDLTSPNNIIYDQMSLQAANDEKDDVKLPGLTDYSNKQLLYIAFAASRCNQISTSHNEAEKSLNHVLQNLDGFSEAFNCKIGTPMNPRNKCSTL